MAVLKLKTDYWVIGGIVAAFILFRRNFTDRLLDVLSSFIPSVEGFSATPYWDVSRYSWGYGTAAPGKTGTISRQQAFNDMIAYLLADYSTLKKKITRTLTVNQWAALLSFAYNLGIGNALELVPYINDGNDSALEYEWNRYVYAGGAVNSHLVKRRKKEFDLWRS
jgi:GH24 family phage-related lysozyme (muramidase)